MIYIHCVRHVKKWWGRCKTKGCGNQLHCRLVSRDIISPRSEPEPKHKILTWSTFTLHLAWGPIHWMLVSHGTSFGWFPRWLIFSWSPRLGLCVKWPLVWHPLNKSALCMYNICKTAIIFITIKHHQTFPYMWLQKKNLTHTMDLHNIIQLHVCVTYYI